MSGLGGTCEVSRDGSWQSTSSEALVPGDLIRLAQSNLVLPCDAVIIKGTCICDESGLTGESMPVRKSEIMDGPGKYSAEADSKNTLFAGTTLLQSETEGSLAVVTETGIRTAKGELISHILYPAEMVFEYDEELKIVLGCSRSTLRFFSEFQYGFSGRSRHSPGYPSSRLLASQSRRSFRRCYQWHL